MNERPGEQEWQYCPVDSSSLLHLGSEAPSSALSGVDEYYCPPCDRAFLAITATAPSSFGIEGLLQVLEVLAWKRIDGELRIVEDKPAGFFSDEQWEEREKNLLLHVRGFLDERLMTERKDLPCYFDGLSIPVIYRVEDSDFVNPVTIAWCESCQTVFAYMRDSVYGWEVVCAFEWDEGTKQHEVMKMVRHRGDSHLGRYAFGNIARLIPRPTG